MKILNHTFFKFAFSFMAILGVSLGFALLVTYFDGFLKKQSREPASQKVLEAEASCDQTKSPC